MSDPILDGFAARAAELAFDIRAYSEGAPPVITPPTQAPARPDFSDNAKAFYFADTYLPREKCKAIAVGEDGWLDDVAPLAGEDFEVAAGTDLTLAANLALGSIIVYGTLRFSEGAYVTFDTIVIMPGGSLEIPQNFTGVFLSTEIDRARDPLLRSRGVISFGKVRMAGARKSAYRPILTPLQAGETRFEVGPAVARDDVTIDGPLTGAPVITPKPSNWQVGDVILLGADASQTPDHGKHPEEFREIKSIIEMPDGSAIVEIDAPSAYSHAPDTRSHLVSAALERLPTSHAHWFAKSFAVNFSRSCVFRNEDPDAAREVKGYFGIYSSDTVIDHVALERLGRTDVRYIDADRNYSFVSEAEIDPNDPAPNVLHRDPIVIDTGERDLDRRVKSTGLSVWSGRLGPVANDVGGSSLGYGVNCRMSAVDIIKPTIANTVGAGFASTTGLEVGDLAQGYIGSVWGANTTGRDMQFKGGDPAAGSGFVHGRALNVFEMIVSSCENPNGNSTRYNPDDALDSVETALYADDAFEFLYDADAKRGAIHTAQFGCYVISCVVGFEYHKGGAREDRTCLNSVVARSLGWNTNAPVAIRYSRHYSIPQTVAIAPSRGNHAGIVFERSHGMFVIAPTLLGFTYPFKIKREDDVTADIAIRVSGAVIKDAAGNDVEPVAAGLLPIEVVASDTLFSTSNVINETTEVVDLNYDPRSIDMSGLEVVSRSAIGDFSSHFGAGEDGKIEAEHLIQKTIRDGWVYRDPDTSEYFTTFRTPAPNPMGEKFLALDLPFVFDAHTMDTRIKPAIPNFGDAETVRSESLASAIESMQAPIGKSTVRKLRRLEPLQPL